MARWKEESKIERVEARKPNGQVMILVLASDPKNRFKGYKLVRKEKL